MERKEAGDGLGRRCDDLEIDEPQPAELLVPRSHETRCPLGPEGLSPMTS